MQYCNDRYPRFGPRCTCPVLCVPLWEGRVDELSGVVDQWARDLSSFGFVWLMSHIASFSRRPFWSGRATQSGERLVGCSMGVYCFLHFSPKPIPPMV